MGHSSILNIIGTIVLPCASLIVAWISLVLSNKKTPEAIIQDFRFPDFYDNPDGMDYTEKNLKKCKKLTLKFQKREKYYEDLLEKVSYELAGKFFNNIATCYFYNIEYKNAIKYYRKALKNFPMERKYMSKYIKYRIVALSRLANIYLDEDIKQAEKKILLALDIILEFSDDIENQEINKELFEKLKEMITEDIVKYFPESTSILCTLGLIYHKKGFLKEAHDSFSMASMLEKKVFHENIKSYYRSKDCILFLYEDHVDKDDKDEMLVMLGKKEDDLINEGVELLELKEKKMCEACEIITTRTHLGVLLIKLKRYEKGKECLEKALELVQINDQYIHQNKKDLISCLYWIDKAYSKGNNTEKYSEAKIIQAFLETFSENTNMFVFKSIILFYNNRNTFICNVVMKFTQKCLYFFVEICAYLKINDINMYYK